VHLRGLSPEEYADRIVTYLRERGIEWDEELVRQAAPLVQEKIETLAQFPDYVRFLFAEVSPDPSLLDERVLDAAAETLADLEPFDAATIEQALRELAERLELKPREAFQPIRVAVTGSKISPGLFESIELLGREKSLERLRVGRGAGV
jgi:glutamyl-tRNA synthetase